MTLVLAVLEAMNHLGMSDIPLVLGGIVPDGDQMKLLAAGVGAVFGPGTSLDQVVSTINRLAGAKEDETS